MARDQSDTHPFCPSSLQLFVSGLRWYIGKVSLSERVKTLSILKVGEFVGEMEI